MSNIGSFEPRGHVELIGSRRSRHRARPARTSRGNSDDLQERLPGLLLVSDWLGIATTGFVLESLSGAQEHEPLLHSLGVLLGATATSNYLHLAGAYEFRSAARLTVQLVKVSIAWAAAFISLVAIGYAVGHPEQFLSPWASLWFLASWLFLAATRCVVARQISSWRRNGRLKRSVAIFGAGPQAVALARHLKARSDEANVLGLFTDGDFSMAAGDVAGDGDALAALAGSGAVDEVILALPWSSHAELNSAIAKFAACHVEVGIDPGISGIAYSPKGFSLVAGIPTLTVQRRPLAGWGAPVKRAEDVVLVSLLLLLLAPVLLLIALMVKIDSRGPLLFRQERYGFNNNRVVVNKFRTMHHDPNPDPSVPQARRNDPRVTRLGAFLRRTSLDELPQLFNVLRGDMSLVGPRPHATAHNEKYAALINGYLGRHRMKPGITGWAQVNGWRGRTETTEQMRRRLEHDVFYIENWSLLLDIKILLKTVPVVVWGDNAY